MTQNVIYPIRAPGAPSGNESWGIQRNKVGGFFPPLSKVGGFSFLIANFRILLAIINVELISVTERENM